jgi:hypothetical protein
MNKTADMKKQKQRSFSVIFTIFIITALVLIGPAQAVQVGFVLDPNDVVAGDDVGFAVEVEIEAPDAYVPITYANIIFEGPDGFSETCKYYQDTGILECDLDVEVLSYVDTTQGYGYGYGYDQGYGYGYDFGYGYGYNPGSIFYGVVWHTPTDALGGDYTVKVVAVAEGDETHEFSSGERGFTIINYCSTMFEMFKGSYNSEEGDDIYNLIFDLNGDGFINIVDFAIFGSYYNDQAWCQEQIEPVEDGVCLEMFSLFEDSYNSEEGDIEYDPRFDLNGDVLVNIEDFAIFGNNYGDEDWCQKILYPTIDDGGDDNSPGSRRLPAVEDEFRRSLSYSVGSSFSYTEGGSRHNARLTNIDYENLEVTIVVKSDPVEVTIAEGNSESVDAERNGGHDLKITVLDIIAENRALILYEGFLEVPVIEELEETNDLNSGNEEEPVEEDEGFLGITGAAIVDTVGGNPVTSLLILILLILIYMQLFSKRKPLRKFRK